MSSVYRGWTLADAFKDKTALYDRGTFKGHFGTPADARAFVDRELAKQARHIEGGAK